MKAHPDKGGRKEDLQKLQAAKEEWQKVRKDAAPKAGRPFAAEPSTAENGTLAPARRRQEYRVKAWVVLLTYYGVADTAQWHRFVSFVRASLKKWRVKLWAATFEACETEGLHTHLTLQFHEGRQDS